MFFLWVKIINIKKISKINVKLFSKIKLGSINPIIFSLNVFITKTAKEENMDDNEEYLNISEMVTQVKINKIPSPYEKANKIPK